MDWEASGPHGGNIARGVGLACDLGPSDGSRRLLTECVCRRVLGVG